MMFEHPICSSNLQGTQVSDDDYMRETFGRNGQKLDPIQLQAPLGLYDEVHQVLKLWKGSNF